MASAEGPEHNSRQFNVDHMVKHLRTKYVGRKVVYKPSTGSTMDDARDEALKGCPEGLAVIADHQTKGRGQGGHTWSSEDTANLYVTFVFQKPEKFQNRVGIQDVEFAGSCAVLQAVHDVGVSTAKLKWKNDVWCSGHKLAGALVETTSLPQDDEHHHNNVIFLLGIGVNVNSDVRRNPSLRKLATSVRTELGGCIVYREELLANICNYLETCMHMDRTDLLKEMNSHQLFQPGSAVKVLDFVDYRELYTGVLTEVRHDWTCVIKDDQGKNHEVGDGVSLRPYPNHFVYVLSEMVECGGDSNLLYDTVLSLLDTTVYTVKLVNMTDLDKGDWACNCDLLVVGDHVTTANETSKQMIRRYVQEGGNLLAIGSGCILVSQSLKSLSGMKCETLVAVVKGMLQVIFKDKSAKDCSFFNPQSEGAYQITDTSGSMTVLARTKSEEVIAGCCGVGEGLVTMVGFNIERTYAEASNLQCLSEKDAKTLSNTVYQRDSFLIDILKTLLQSKSNNDR
ncbi:uncharacterized protein LOC135467751 [Liolophura sinensis]|uniref:uncharacterized protein LOC135467751 n=1 Tax=Liolophura sinensis TaxID=3198878 RepID=UPI00315959D4